MKRSSWVVATLVAALAAVVCGAMWALSSPLGSSPDDGYHQATIWCVDATGTTSPDTCRVVGESETTGGRVVELPALVASPSCYAFQPVESAACQRPLQGETTRSETIDNGSYPGGFYRVMHLLVRDSIPESVLSMRILNVALGALLLGAIALVTTTAVRRLMITTLVPVLIPLGWFILASINPSSWAVSGLTAYGFALHTVLLLQGRRRLVAAGLGVLGLVMALSARGDAPAYAGVITVALCVLHWRTLWADRASPRRAGPRRGRVPVAGAGGVAGRLDRRCLRRDRADPWATWCPTCCRSSRPCSAACSGTRSAWAGSTRRSARSRPIPSPSSSASWGSAGSDGSPCRRRWLPPSSSCPCWCSR